MDGRPTWTDCDEAGEKIRCDVTSKVGGHACNIMTSSFSTSFSPFLI